MSWLSGWTYRAPIAVDCTGGAGTVDVVAIVRADLENFWARVLASGADIRVTLGDGVTLVTFEAASYDYANRVLTLEIDNVTLTGVGMQQLFLYWGNASASSVSTSVSPSSPKTGYILGEQPRSDLVVVAQPQGVGETKSRTIVTKQASEEIDIYFDLDLLLARKIEAYGKSWLDEEITYVTYDIQLAAASQAAMIDATLTRFAQGSGKRHGAVRVRAKAGASGTTYSVIVTAYTTTSRIIQGRCRLSVQNTAE